MAKQTKTTSKVVANTTIGGTPAIAAASLVGKVVAPQVKKIDEELLQAAGDVQAEQVVAVDAAPASVGFELAQAAGAAAGSAGAGAGAAGMSIGTIAAIGAGVAVAANASKSSSSTAAASTGTTGTTTPAAVAGQTFTLTKDADISGVLVGSGGTVGTTGADTFTSVNTAAQSTYGTGDVLVGGDGADILNITTDNVALGAATSVVGIETINVTAVGSGVVNAASFDATGVVALGSTLNVSNKQAVTNGGFTVTALGTGATVAADATITGTLSVTTAASTSQTLTLAANSAATQTVVLTQSGTADTATISAAGTVGLTATNIETLNFSGNGAAATYTMASALGATANNFTGTQSVTLAGTSANFTAKTVTDNTTAGTTTIDLTAITANTDLTKAAVDLVTLTGDRAAALSLSVKAGQAIKSAVAHTTGDITLSIDNGDTTYADGVVTLELTKEHGTGIGYAVAAKSATADNITTLNIINNTSKQDTLEVLATADTAVVFSGSKSVTLETTSTAKSVTQNGSGALTVNIDGTADIATVTGGSGADSFLVAAGYSTGALTLDGGAGGSDKIKLAAAESLAALKLSNIEIIDLSTTGVTTVADFKASQLSGKDYIFVGAGGDDTVEIDANLSIDTLNIDLSKLVMDSANVKSIVIDGSKVTADFGATNAQTFVGSTVADTYTGSGGADTITGGNGADVITGAGGIDTINLAEATAASDKVVLATALADRDVINGFTAGATNGDILTFTGAKANNVAATAGAAAAGDVVAYSTSGNLTGAAGKYVYNVSVEAASTLSNDGASVLNALVTGTGSGTITAANAADILYFLVSDGTNVGVYRGSASGVTADTAVTADEITLVGTLNSTTLANVVYQNFLFA